MSDATFEELKRLRESDGAGAAIDRLIETEREQKNHLGLFEAKLLKTKHDMGLPTAQPMSLADVPEDKRIAFEDAYIAAAREVGKMLLDEGRIPEAWMFFRQIREPGPVREALEAISANRELDDETEQLLGVALHEGVHPVKGLQIMLHTHGTCNTVTAFDQTAGQMTGDDQRAAAEVLVDHLYGELAAVVRQEVEQRMAMLPPDQSLRELITGREWLFEGGNYHVDVSHLHSVVRFARALNGDSPQLGKAIELCEYGQQLDSQFQYPGDPPFDDFYEAHGWFLRALADDRRDEALDYFREKLRAEPDEQDKPLLAYVLVDLLVRCGRTDEAVDVAAEHLKDVDESSGFSFAKLCRDAGRMDRLESVAREKGNLVAFTAAILG